MLDLVNADSKALPPLIAAHPAQRLASESPAFSALCLRAATALRMASVDIVARWEQQSRTVALREPHGPTSSTTSVATMVLGPLADAMASDGATSDDLVGVGLALGEEEFDSGSSLHHALKGLDLLAAMASYAVERSLGNEAGATAADGVRLSRRLQQVVSLLTLAATKGYTQAMGDAMRDRFRRLRHDLRNPLGTIKSVLAMMDDESMPAEARAHPRFRAMAKRNARSLGELISDRLSDMAAVMPTLVQQRVSLRTVACGVRRDLRGRAGARGVTVVVGSAPTRVIVDAVALELTLHELLLAALDEAREGDELKVEFGELHVERAEVTLLCVPPRRPIANGPAVERLATLARRMGAELQVADRAMTLLISVCRVEITVRDAEMPPLPIADTADTAQAAGSLSGGRKSGHDIRGASEREHGQSRPL